MVEKVEMDLATALSTAERMKGFFRAFERLDEFTQYIRDAEIRVKNLTNAEASLMKEKSLLEEGIASIRLGLESWKKEVKSVKEVLDKSLDQKRTEIKDAIEKEESEFEKRISYMRDDLADREEEYREDMEKMRVAIFKETEVLASLKAEVFSYREAMQKAVGTLTATQER